MNAELFQDAETVYAFLSEAPSASHADLILAAGSHDLRVAEYAAALYHAGAAPLVVCSGGFGKMTAERFPLPEGVLFARRCIALGVPESAVLIEDRSTNTGENICFTRELFASRGIFPSSGIITCKPYMARRVWATGTKQWSEVRWYVRTPPLSFDEYPSADCPLDSTVSLMVGDLQRCRIYAEKGFQAAVDVPEEVWAANERLIAGGFNQYVIRE